MIKEVKKMKTEDNKIKSGISLKSKVTAALGIGLVAFLISWLFVFAADFNVYQNISIIVASLLGTFALIGTTWMWGVKFPEDSSLLLWISKI